MSSMLRTIQRQVRRDPPRLEKVKNTYARPVQHCFTCNRIVRCDRADRGCCSSCIEIHAPYHGTRR